MVNDTANNIEDVFIKLIEEAATLNVAMESETRANRAWGTDIFKQIKEWIQKVQDFASKVKADSVSITGGFPVGLSLTVTFPVKRNNE